MQNICIVVPCYNEGKRLCVPSFLNFLKESTHSICFVNDGSKDNTLEVLHSIKREMPSKVQVVDLENNRGKAEAVRQGVLVALTQKEYEFIGYFDADLATPLQEVDFLLSHFTAGIEVVIGSRVKRLGSDIKRYPHRHYLGRVFATMASMTLRMEVYDSQCGAKIFRKDIGQKLFSTSFESRWLFDLEILYRLKHLDPNNFNRKIMEVPLRTWHEKGDTRIRPFEFISAPIELLKIKRKTLRK